jgi:hypothetical protein
MLELSHCFVVIAFSEVNTPARQPPSIGGYLFRLSHAEVAEKIEDVIRLDTRIHTVSNRIVHLLRVCKRTVAVPNDVEVSEVEVGREPNVTHSSFSLVIGPKFNATNWLDCAATSLDAGNQPTS